MSEKNTSDSYEVGYRRPPKNTQFKKGVSGNPKGRPRRALDFNQALLRESRVSITINENGRRRRISKHEAVIKQMINKAMSGSMPAARTYFDRHQIASEQEKAALLEATQSGDTGEYNELNSLTDEELWRIARGGLENTEQKRKKGHISNAD